MSKRAPETQLTQDNADVEDDDVEDSGTFERASTEAISQRKIKVARRTGSEANTTSSPKGLFSGVSLLKPNSGAVAGEASLQNTSQQSSISNYFGDAKITLPASSTMAPKASNGKSASSSQMYLANLKSLNTSVLSWIEKHVRENPYVDLSPVFNDYGKHLKDLEQKYGEGPHTTDTSDSDSQATDTEGRSQRSESAQPSSQNSETSVDSQRAVVGSPSSLLQRGSLNFLAPKSSPLTIQPPITMATTSIVTATTTEDNEDAPPVIQKSDPGPGETRCKLFYLKPGLSDAVTLGVGFIKVEKKEDKAWISMRADTALKKVLMSVFVDSNIPLSIDKKTLLLITHPNPPLDLKSEDLKNKPITYIIRVKTENEAQNLYDSIKSTFSK